jgi:hypothetical protein
MPIIRSTTTLRSVISPKNAPYGRHTPRPNMGTKFRPIFLVSPYTIEDFLGLI